MKKRLFAALMCLCLVCALLPTTALAADANYTMDFSMTGLVNWSGDYVDYSENNASGTDWSWTYANKTLTLNGFNFTTSEPAAIKLPAGATLVLAGTNMVTSTYDGSGAPGTASVSSPLER